MMGYAHNNTKIKLEPKPLEEKDSPGFKNSNVSLDQSFIEFEEHPDTFLDSLLNFDGWVEDHPSSFVVQVMNTEEKPIFESKKVKEDEICESAKLADLGDLIQEGMGRVRLTTGVDSVDGLGSTEVTGGEETPNADDNGAIDDEKDSEGKDSEESEDSGSDSESESESESESSSSSSSDDEKEEEVEDDDDENGIKKVKGEVEMEEGEIRDFGVEDEDGDDDTVKGPIRSKNEVQDLPPVPPVTATLEPHHKTLPVGVVLSIMGPQVIVEGVENHNPLSEGSILWITESRLPLGAVDEIFGPVKNPYYIIRYNSETEVPSGIQQGSAVSFVQEFADFVLNNNNNLYKKGYDASGENDEELSDELEFSDDEKEAEYKKMKKLSKRGLSESKNGSTKSRNRGGHRNNDRRQGSPVIRPPFQPFPATGLSCQPSPATGPSNQPFPATGPQCQPFPATGPQCQPFSATGPPSQPSPGTGPPCQPSAPLPGMANFNGPYGFLAVPSQSMGFFPNGPFMQPNFTQQPFQNMRMSNFAPFHPQFNANGPMFPPPNYGPNPGFGSWPAGQNNFNQPLVGPPLMGFPGVFSGMPQGGGMPPDGHQMENNGGVRPPFVAGNAEMSQSRGGRRGFQRGGGRFRGGRGGRSGRNGPQSR